LTFHSNAQVEDDGSGKTDENAQSRRRGLFFAQQNNIGFREVDRLVEMPFDHLAATPLNKIHLCNSVNHTDWIVNMIILKMLKLEI
jgi:hypothetical protein